MSEKLEFDKGMQLKTICQNCSETCQGALYKCCRLASGSLIINSNANQQDCLSLRVYTHHVIVGLYARLRSLQNFEKYLIITFTVQSIHEHGGKKMWKSGSSFQGNVTIWWEILYFSIRKYIRNSAKCNYPPGKNTFFSRPVHETSGTLHTVHDWLAVDVKYHGLYVPGVTATCTHCIHSSLWTCHVLFT